MRYLETKWLNREINLLPCVDGYARTMAILTGRISARHLADEAEVRKTLRSVAAVLYRHLKSELKKARPGVDAPLEKKVIHNCSVTQLKRELAKAIDRVEEKFNGWR